MQSILEILSSLGFNWHIALANFVNFLIVFVILYKLVFKKLGATLEARSAKINDGLNAAEEGQRALLAAEKEKNAILHEAQVQKSNLIKDAYTQAEILVAQIKKEAEVDVTQTKEALVEEQKQLESKIEKAFKEKADHIVATLYAKTLGEKMTRESNESFIASSLK